MQQYTIFIPFFENPNNTYKLYIPVNIIINKGIPKIILLGKISSNLQRYSNKIQAILKGQKLLKFKQIIIEFPDFPYIQYSKTQYIDYLIHILLIILQKLESKLNKLKFRKIDWTKFLNTKTQIQFLIFPPNYANYIHKNMFLLDKYANYFFIYPKQENYIQTIITPQAHMYTSHIIQKFKKHNLQTLSLELKNYNLLVQKLQTIIKINNTMQYKQLLNYLYLPRIQIITNIKLQFLLNHISNLLLNNTISLVIIDTCSCSNLFSNHHCVCTKANMSKYVNQISQLLDYSNKHQMFIPETMNFKTLTKDQILQIYNQIM